MTKLKSDVLFSALLLFAAGSAAYGAIDTTAAKAAFQFLEESVSPRHLAMGNAGCAMPGAGFCIYNPAQPFFSNAPALSLGYSPLPGDLKAVFAEGFFSRSDLFFGMHLSNFTISDIIPSTVQGTNENAAFSSGFSLISLAAGLKRERYSLAIDVSGMQDRIGVSTAYGISVSAGAAYTAVPGKLSLGLALLNEGTATGYTDDTKNWGDGDRLPRSARLGAAYSDTLKRVPVVVALDVVYRDVGNKIRNVKNVAPRVTVPLGVEAWLSENIALRLGKRINFETELVNFGLGFRFRPLSFDASFVIAKLYQDVEVKPAFGLTYTPAPKNKAKTVITAPAAEVKPLAPEPSSRPAQAPVEPKVEPQQPPPDPKAEQPKTEREPQQLSAPQAQPPQPSPAASPAQPQIAPQPQPAPSPQQEPGPQEAQPLPQ